MAKVELKPGDYVLTYGMDEENYHKVARAFMDAGAENKGDCSYHRSSGNDAHLGWDDRDDELWHVGFKATGFRGRQLTIAEVLGEVGDELKVGDRVRIVEGCEWDRDAPANPKCPGCIVGNGNIEGWLRVKWDNGAFNAYPKDCLRIDEPSMPEVGSRWLLECGFDDIEEVEVIAERHGDSVVEIVSTGAVHKVAPQHLKPIKSERDKAVEEMLASMEHAVENHTGIPCDSHQLGLAASALYDAGYRKVGS